MHDSAYKYLLFNPPFRHRTKFRNVRNSLDDQSIFPYQSTSHQYMPQVIYFPNIDKNIFYFGIDIR